MISQCMYKLHNVTKYHCDIVFVSSFFCSFHHWLTLHSRKQFYRHQAGSAISYPFIARSKIQRAPSLSDGHTNRSCVRMTLLLMGHKVLRHIQQTAAYPRGVKPCSAETTVSGLSHWLNLLNFRECIKLPTDDQCPPLSRMLLGRFIMARTHSERRQFKNVQFVISGIWTDCLISWAISVA